MKIYIVERDNPYYRPEPEVFIDGDIAIRTVKEEYSNQKKELRILPEDDCFGCYWNFLDNDCCGDALIDRESDGERWEWRITEHEVKIH